MSLENFKLHKELLKVSIMDALKKNQLYHKPQTNFLTSKYSNFKNHMKPKTILYKDIVLCWTKNSTENHYIFRITSKSAINHSQNCCIFVKSPIANLRLNVV